MFIMYILGMFVLKRLMKTIVLGAAFTLLTACNPVAESTSSNATDCKLVARMIADGEKPVGNAKHEARIAERIRGTVPSSYAFVFQHCKRNY